MYSNPLLPAKETARDIVGNAIMKAIRSGSLPDSKIPEFAIEVPNDSANGDISCNAALVSAKTLHMSPRIIAEKIIEKSYLEGSVFSTVTVAGPGFINFFFRSDYYKGVMNDVLNEGEDYGKTDFGGNKKIMVEFVSANPTGPMHIGNARGAALGDCLASVLSAAGWRVTREFYLNDTGNQVTKFGRSLGARYMQIFVSEYPFPEDGYYGEDITAHAKAYAEIHGDALVDVPEEIRNSALADYALPKNIEALERDLLRYRVKYDVWFKESDLHSSGLVKKAVDILTERGATYEKDGAIWYRSSRFSEKYGGNKNARKGLEGEVNNEEKDEVLVRANGVPTYFAADIAYHYNKFFIRGFDQVINIWGADHHGHVARMKGSMDAIGLDGEKLDVVLMQLVRLVREGEQVRVSKRSGNAITLVDLLDEIPIDAARFFFNLREPSSHLDFDMGLAIQQNGDNPVYYVQYAHARICSILKALKSEGFNTDRFENVQYEILDSEEEKTLIRHIGTLPSVLQSSAADYDPSKVTRYVLDTAALFHKFYAACRVKESEENIRLARTALCFATRQVLRNCLAILKIEAPESM